MEKAQEGAQLLFFATGTGGDGNAELVQSGADDPMHTLNPRLTAPLPRWSWGEGKGVCQFVVVYECLAARGTTDEGELSQHRIAQTQSGRLEVTQTEHCRGQALEAQR